jgi:tetratricopeptide (TPR) repeat protein
MKKSRRSAPQPPATDAASMARPASPGALVLAAFLLVVVTFVVYAPSLDNGFTNWDDPVYVHENPLLVNPDLGAILRTPVSGNYHPLTILSLAWNYKISGLNPGSYHWVNLILHLANTALVFVFVWMLSRGRFWAAVATSLIFGIHPMHVESVAWVSERKDVLYTFFYLLGLVAYLRYLERRALAWLGAGAAMLVLSLASKPAAVVFPLTLLAVDYLRGRTDWTRAIVEKAPLFALSMAGGVFALKAQSAVGAVGAASDWSFFEKLLFAAYGSVMYVLKFVAPFGLSALYPYPLKSVGLGPQYFASLLAVVLVVPLVLFVFGRVRPVMFGLAFYIINVILVLQFVSVGQAVIAERYTYVPYIGLLVAVTWWMDDRRPVGAPGRGPSVAAWAFIGLLVPVCLYQTWVRVGVWKDSRALWTDASAKRPSATAYNNLGNVELGESRFEQAERLFAEAVRLDPFHPRARYNLGLVLMKRDQLPEAITQYREAVRLATAPSVMQEARFGLGSALEKSGRPEEAMEQYREVLRLNADHVEAHNSMGNVFAAQGRFEDAAAQYREVIRLSPADAKARSNLANVRLTQGRTAEAIDLYREAIRLKPDFPDAHANLGAALAQSGKAAEAEKEFRRALELNPGDRNIAQNLALLVGSRRR